jgi:hypothetical protein
MYQSLAARGSAVQPVQLPKRRARSRSGASVTCPGYLAIRTNWTRYMSDKHVARFFGIEKGIAPIMTMKIQQCGLMEY